MSCRPRPTRSAEELGQLPSGYGGGPSDYYGAFIQIAHVGQQPQCREPAFRILRVVETKKEASKVQRKLQAELGDWQHPLHLRNSSTLICKDLDRQVSAEYVLPKVLEFKQILGSYSLN